MSASPLIVCASMRCERRRIPECKPEKAGCKDVNETFGKSYGSPLTSQTIDPGPETCLKKRDPCRTLPQVPRNFGATNASDCKRNITNGSFNAALIGGGPRSGPGTPMTQPGLRRETKNLRHAATKLRFESAALK